MSCSFYLCKYTSLLPFKICNILQSLLSIGNFGWQFICLVCVLTTFKDFPRHKIHSWSMKDSASAKLLVTSNHNSDFKNSKGHIDQNCKCKRGMYNWQLLDWLKGYYNYIIWETYWVDITFYTFIGWYTSIQGAKVMKSVYRRINKLI